MPAAPAAGARLRERIDSALPVLRAAGGRLLAAEPADAVYREYLATMHATVRASVPLMETALGRARALAAEDPVASRLAGYLPEHIVEETDHDEWLLEDLEVIGVARSRVVSRPPSARVAAVVGAQYYWILHSHPVTLVGYMAVLERHAPTPRVIDRLIQRTGFDLAAFRTMVEHADLDQGHAEDVFGLVDDLGLDARLSALLATSATHTVMGMAAVLDEVVDAVIEAGGAGSPAHRAVRPGTPSRHS